MAERNERNVLRGRLRHSARGNYQSATTPGPVVEAGGFGSAARALVKMATRSKYPKRAPKGSSTEEKMAYTQDRAKALQAARDRDKAKAQAAKEKRISKYTKKKDAARARTEARVQKRTRREQAEARDRAAATSENQRGVREFYALKDAHARKRGMPAPSPRTPLRRSAMTERERVKIEQDRARQQSIARANELAKSQGKYRPMTRPKNPFSNL